MQEWASILHKFLTQFANKIKIASIENGKIEYAGFFPMKTSKCASQAIAGHGNSQSIEFSEYESKALHGARDVDDYHQTSQAACSLDSVPSIVNSK